MVECLGSDIVLAGFSAENEPFLGIPPNSLSRRESWLVHCLNLRGLLSDLSCLR
jgi:hypothetical protein